MSALRTGDTDGPLFISKYNTVGTREGTPTITRPANLDSAAKSPDTTHTSAAAWTPRYARRRLPNPHSFWFLMDLRQVAHLHLRTASKIH